MRPPDAPSPPPIEVTASAYILPNAQVAGPNAFGDEPIVIYRGERLRWFNLDSVTHAVVADTHDVADFAETGNLAPAGERLFVMNSTGTTKIHCAIHPQMVGTLIVRDR